MDELFKDFYLLMPYGRGQDFEDKYINFASLVLGRYVHILYFEPEESGNVLANISNVEKDDCILLFADFEENDEKTKAFFDSVRENYNHLESRYEFLGKPERKAILKDAVNVFGVERQTQKAVEEMSELIKELTKPGMLWDIQEEIVDVQIMLEQLKDIYGWDEEMEQRKLIRLRRLIADEESRSDGQGDDAASETQRG